MSAFTGNGQVTLLAPAAYATIAVMCCQIIVTFLSVTRVEANLGVKSFFGAFMCHFCTFLCKHPNVCDKFADNWTSGIGSCRASHCLYMVAPVCEAAFSYVM